LTKYGYIAIIFVCIKKEKNMKIIATKAQTKAGTSKKVYSQPTLVSYGKLSEFTASGSGANGESVTNPTKMA
jgi:hypothetical protein